jgi:hypothetical protein
MAHIYESIQNGVINFTNPGTGKTVSLFKGSRVTVDQKLAGGYLRVLRYIGEASEVETGSKQKAKVADKITKVEEVVQPVVEAVEAKVEDTVAAVKEEEVVAPVEEAPAVEATPAPAVEETTKKPHTNAKKKR